MIRWLGALALMGACEGAVAEPPPTRASEFRSAAVDARLAGAGEVVRTRGFADDGDALRGFLVNRGVATESSTLRSGRCYLFVSVGSEQLESLDLTLYDSAGSEVQRATTGAAPALRYCPSQSGDYFVSLRATGAGLYALQRFQGPRGLDIRLDDLVPSGGD